MELGRRLPLIALAALALAGCGGGGSSKSAEQTTTDANGCRPVKAPQGKERTEAKPTKPLAAGTTYTVTFATNCGSFTVRLDLKASPKTSASFVSLVQHKFFDATVFHRIVPGFVIQGGDPTGGGTSGPGYSTVDTPPPGTKYTHGVVAMAKTGAEAPGTSGSQFFVVTASDAQLPPDYAVLGKVTGGLDVVDKIGQLGDPASGGQGVPIEVVEIQKATLTVH